MTLRYLSGLAMLITIAIIWGVGFVFQREGMEQLGPRQSLEDFSLHL